MGFCLRECKTILRVSGFCYCVKTTFAALRLGSWLAKCSDELLQKQHALLCKVKPELQSVFIVNCEDARENPCCENVAEYI